MMMPHTLTRTVTVLTKLPLETSRTVLDPHSTVSPWMTTVMLTTMTVMSLDDNDDNDDDNNGNRLITKFPENLLHPSRFFPTQTLAGRELR